MMGHGSYSIIISRCVTIMIVNNAGELLYIRPHLVDSQFLISHLHGVLAVEEYGNGRHGLQTLTTLLAAKCVV